MWAIIIIRDFNVISRDYCFFGLVAQPTNELHVMSSLTIDQNE
jgi:hypothetical protein